MSYRGGKIPKGLSKQMRKLLSDLDELAVRGSDADRKVNGNASVATTPTNVQPGLQPTLTFTEDSTSGTITSIPIARPGTLRLAKYKGSPTFAAGGNLDLAGPSFTPDPNAAVAWVSDGSKWLEAGRGPGAETFVPARRYGVVPDTSADMTSRIQRAFDECPLGCTLVFEPGTYVITNTVIITRAINLYAYGAVFHLTTSTPTTTFSPGIPETYPDPAVGPREAGTLTNLAAVIIGTDSGAQIAKCTYRGLFITRTAADNTAASRLYAGLIIRGCVECVFTDMQVTNYLNGIALNGNIGIFLNIIDSVKTANCRYAITLYTAGSIGFVNHNLFKNCRTTIGAPVFADGSYIKEQWEYVRLLWASGAANGVPNGNTFVSCDLEGGINVEAGRKVRCEGMYNSFVDCRYENQPAATQITIGEVSRANSNFSRNQFIRGYDLHLITSNDRIEFLATLSNVNSGNVFAGTDANWMAARVSGAPPKSTSWRFQSTSSTAAVTGVLTNLAQEVLRFYAVQASPFSAQGTLEFLDTTETQRNLFGMETASPYDLRTLAGVNIANVFRARVSGIDADIRNPQAGGDIITNVGTGQVRFYSSNSGNNEVVQIADASQVVRFALQAATSDFTGVTGVIKWFDTDGTTVRNYLYQSTTLLPGAGSFKPLTIRNGAWINSAQADADTRISTVGSLSTVYVDSSTDRIGFGTNTPNRLVEVFGGNTCGATPQLRIAGVGSAIAEVGAFDDCSYGGGALQLAPSGGSAALKWIHMFGTNDANALTFLDDGGGFWIGRQKAGYDSNYGVTTGQHHRFFVNFNETFRVGTNDCAFQGMVLFQGTNAVRNTTIDAITCEAAETTGLGSQAGFGTSLLWKLETATNGVFQSAARWENTWDVATSGSEDSHTSFLIMDAGTFKELVRFDGGNQRVEIKTLDGATTGSLESLRLQRESSGGAAGNTFGTYLSYRLENATNGSFTEAGRIQCRWEDATNGAEDSSIAQFIQVGGALKELARLTSPGGVQPELLIHDNNHTVQQIRLFTDGSAVFNEQGNDADHRIEGDTDVNLLFCDASTDRVGIGMNNPSQKLEVTGNVRADMLLVDSDPGGVASTIGIVNSIAAVSGGGALTLGTTGGGPTGGTQSHWLKFYDGTTARYIPVWT